MYYMVFYDTNGNKTGKVKGLTLEEVDIIYRGCLTIVKKSHKKPMDNADAYNAFFPTVWDEATGERVAGY